MKTSTVADGEDGKHGTEVDGDFSNPDAVEKL